MKKSQTTTISVFIGVIIIVISFFVIFLFISKTGSNVSNEAEDIYCRALIMGKEFTKVPVLGSYIFEINKRCFTEDLKIENKDEISSLDPIAESMKRCWFRYGEGKFDFLENFDDPSGDWCFKCANIEFKNKYADDYEYEDLLNYLKKKYITIQKDTSYGKVGERISYYDYLNVISTSFSNDDSIREDFLNTLETNQDEFTKEFFLLLDLELENFLNSYKNKKIRASEDLFIVYRYIRVDRDLIDITLDFFEEEEELSQKYISQVMGIEQSNSADFKQALLYEAGIALKTDKGKQIAKTSLKTLMKVAKRYPILTVILATGTYGASRATNNYIHYVDVMSEEQYYRICGTQRFQQ